MRSQLLALFAAFPVIGQNVLHVGSGGFAQIHQALAVAQAGDVIEIDAGVYDSFAVTAGVTLRPSGTARPSVFVGGPCTFAVPAGEMAAVFGLDLLTGARMLGGAVTFEVSLVRGMSVDTPAEVVLLDSTVSSPLGGGAAMRVLGHVAAVNTVIRGLQILFPGDGILVDGGSLQLAGCMVRGSDSISSPHPAGRALTVLAGKAWLADCAIAGGTATMSYGSAGIVNQTAIPVAAARTTVTGGQGTAVAGPYDPNAPLLGLSPPGQGLLRGTLFTFSTVGPPGMPLYVFVALRTAVAAHPALAQPAWFGGGGDLWAQSVADPAGMAAFQGAIPNQNWLRDVRLSFHVLGLDASGAVQVAPPLASLVQ